MKQAINAVTCLLLALATSGGARADSGIDLFEQAISLCEVAGSPQKFHQQVILLRVVYTAAPEHAPSTTGDAHCAYERIVVHHRSDYRQDEDVSAALRSLLPRDMSLLSGPELKPLDAVYKGKFRIVIDGIECSSLCSRFALDDAELVAVRRRQ